jgi:lysylphosphatidylglycerol synthetase-like protein (DUF2156 family)
VRPTPADRRRYLPGKEPELMSDAAKQLVLLLWICAGLIAVLGLVSLAAALSPMGNSGWLFLAFAFYHGAGFSLCFFHVLNSELYGFDKRLNSFWCMTNLTLLMLFVLGMLGNVLWFPEQWGEHPEYHDSVGRFGAEVWRS